MPFRRQHEGSDLCAIFVHAGAGFHSHANEKLHLGAVNDAARVAMAVLKNGGDATDAVEMAIRLLEDREITNAGYGSNLTVEGQVECDATMVDHLGRSGAVGCVSQIKNPIALARTILDASSQPLSLQRVPPNLLVGPGAAEYAAEQGHSVLPHDYLISENARNRWLVWKQDLLDVAIQAHYHRSASKPKERDQLMRHDSVLDQSKHNTLNQPPGRVDTSIPDLPTMIPSSGPLPVSASDTATSCRVYEPSPSNISKHAVDPSNYPHYVGSTEAQFSRRGYYDFAETPTVSSLNSPAKRQRLDGSEDQPLQGDIAVKLTHPKAEKLEQHPQIREDHITDTVGAIAIDCFGNIAAGSSSGGIGMKHKGRCGPAALVGIGTAVIPIDPGDPDKTSVATVTSGTGEHMATTAAAATAADRIYFRVRREGSKLTSCNEDEALNSMIKNDFMKHPGVCNQPCVGAIGILCVKKMRDGIYFYFGHNTDSFAIASMHSEERKPVCVMSRSKGNGSIAQGGRVAKTRRAKH